jgi:hypothetical protein
MRFLIFYSSPFNTGIIEIKIKSCHMGPALTHIYMHTTFLAHSRKPHTNHVAVAEEKKSQHLIETDGIAKKSRKE